MVGPKPCKGNTAELLMYRGPAVAAEPQTCRSFATARASISPMKTRIFAVITIAFSIPAHAQLQQMQQAAPSGHHGGRSGSVTVIPTAGLKAEPIQIGGHKGWKIKVPGGRALATPAVVGDTVFVGGGFGSHEFYAFDAQSGAPRWA